MEEPTVLDYVKSKLFFWRNESIEIPTGESETDKDELKLSSSDIQITNLGLDNRLEKSRRPDQQLLPPGSGWTIIRISVTLLLAFFAQVSLSPPERSISTGVLFYVLSALWLIWTHFSDDWKLAVQPAVILKEDTFSFRLLGLMVSVLCMFLAFLMFGSNVFTSPNLVVLAISLFAFIYAFWQPNQNQPDIFERLRNSWTKFLTDGISFSPWTLLVVGVFGVSAFFRFYMLDQVPAEMFSDHAEKLIDVGDVLEGQHWVFFVRNTGREAFQMYLTAAMALIFDTGLSFMSLKLGTAICGLLTIPFIYLLGKEVANPRVGLLAMFFAGIAYWPNVISRVALRFTLFPTFTAPSLYFLIRGLRRQTRNDFILAGIFMGLGLHGYSSFRFVPIVAVIAVLIYLFHQKSRMLRRRAIFGLSLTTVTSFIIFLPLFRFALQDRFMFSYRMMTRMGEIERPFPGNPTIIFFENLWKSITMFFYDNGHIWVHSIPFRPALGVVSAVFLFFGLVLIIVRYFRKRNWLDIFLPLSIPLLMMPSILSLAFPEENPSLNRSGGALIVVFLIVALAFDGLLTNLQSRRLSPIGSGLAVGLGIILLAGSVFQNFDLVFVQFNNQFRNNAWNTSELGGVIRQYADSYGSEQTAWVVPYPHWVDTRLVGYRAGVPEYDYALWREDISRTVDEPGAKLFLLKPEDMETLDLLTELYPTGVIKLYDSAVDGRDFYMFTVPPNR